MKVEEFAPDMGHTDEFFDLVAIMLLITRIAVGVEKAFIVFEILARSLALSVCGVFIRHRRRRWRSVGTLVTDVDPIFIVLQIAVRRRPPDAYY